MPMGCPKSMAVPYKLRRAGFQTCRLNGLPKDSADRDIRPTNFVGPISILQDASVGQVSKPADGMVFLKTRRIGISALQTS